MNGAGTKKKVPIIEKKMDRNMFVDQFRFFTTYTQWTELSAITKCYVTDICVPSYDLNNVPVFMLHQQYKLQIWIIVAWPNETVLQYIVKHIPIVAGFFFRTNAIQTPGDLFELFNKTVSLKNKLPRQLKIGWSFQWHQYPFSPKHFGWKKRNELSRPFLPPVESVLDACIINWQNILRPQQFHIYFKRLIHLRVPSNVIIVPFIPAKPVALYEKNVLGITTHHLSLESIPFFFPLEKPIWLELPCSSKKL
jgi:hypothetical protein